MNCIGMIVGFVFLRLLKDIVLFPLGKIIFRSTLISFITTNSP